MAGRNTAVERLRWRFLEGFLEARLLAAGDVWDWMGLPISTTVGGRSWRWKAAGSGRAVSTIITRVWTMGARLQRVNNSRP